MYVCVYIAIQFYINFYLIDIILYNNIIFIVVLFTFKYLIEL